MAVYTEVLDTELSTFLAGYDIGDLVAYRGIAEGIENSNYTLRTTAGDYILTLYERRVDPADLPWFIGLMRHCAQGGVACPLPVQDRNGAALGRLAARPAAITTFLPGVWPRRPQPWHCRALGETLARLHATAAGYTPARLNALGPGAWPTLLARVRDGADPALAGAVAEALDRVLAAWPTALPRGQIHADLFPDNVFFLGTELSGLIDFYFACTDFLAYDLAVCLNAWCFEPDFSFNATAARALFTGYASVRPLVPEERAAMPVLAAGAALRFVLTRLYDWVNTPADALVTRKDPLDFWRRVRFHLQTESFGAYGV